MNKVFMFDIETTGTNPKRDEVLQITFLELIKKGDYYNPGHLFNQYLHTDRQPTNPFQLKHQVELFRKCNAVAPTSVEAVRRAIKAYFFACGVPDQPLLMGKSLSMLDIPFVVEKGFMVPPGRDPVTNEITGDFHYRVFEMAGAITLAQDVLGIADRQRLEETAFASYPEIKMPEGEAHDGVYDCFYQAREYNGLIRMCSGGIF